MEKCSRTGVDIHDTDFGYTLSVIGGKYKMIILYWIAEYQVVRYNELRRKIGNISDKTLSKTLKELEQDQLIIRNEYPQIPPKVEYTLSKRGNSIIPVLDLMCKWGGENRLE